MVSKNCTSLAVCNEHDQSKLYVNMHVCKEYDLRQTKALTLGIHSIFHSKLLFWIVHIGIENCCIMFAFSGLFYFLDLALADIAELFGNLTTLLQQTA